ncbi:MAG: hypothetical protein AAB664_02150 [Patescibacteria group bacterium]
MAGFNQIVKFILRLLFEDETITIAPCNGSRYIAKEEKVFKAGINSNFKNWGLDKAGSSTDAVSVSIHKTTNHATFVQMFSSLGSDLNKLCLTQHQIVEYWEKHCDKLRQDGFVTFFLFKEEENFFVGSVVLSLDGLYVGVCRFEIGGVWKSERTHRVITPKLAHLHGKPLDPLSL